MVKPRWTSKSYIHLQDGRVLPVSTVEDAGGSQMRVERHLASAQWEQMVQVMMQRAGEIAPASHSTETDGVWGGSARKT